MVEKVNWWVVAVAALVGSGAVVLAVVLGGANRQTFSALLLEFGAAIALVGILVILERNVMMRVTEAAGAAATEAADRATSELRERIIHLENLDDEQLQERDRRRKEADSLVDRLREEELTPSAIADLLVSAYKQNLFDWQKFRVRTSGDPDSHILYVLAAQPPYGMPTVWFDVERFDHTDTRMANGQLVNPPPTRETTVLWVPPHDAAHVAAEIEAVLQRLNAPLRGLRLRYALDQLVLSVNAMRSARAAEAGSPLRLNGRLALVINRGWAITSFGLESLSTNIAFKATWHPFRHAVSAPGYPQDDGTSAEIGTLPIGEDSDLWTEATDWLSGRERWQFRASGEQPTS
jgi:hypothetical protein